MSTNSPFWIFVTNFAGMGGKLSPMMKGVAGFALLPEKTPSPSLPSLSSGGCSSPKVGNRRSTTSRVGSTPSPSARETPGDVINRLTYSYTPPLGRQPWYAILKRTICRQQYLPPLIYLANSPVGLSSFRFGCRSEWSSCSSRWRASCMPFRSVAPVLPTSQAGLTSLSDILWVLRVTSTGKN